MKFKFPVKINISLQISIFLIIVAFIPIVVMMALKTYESQQLTMLENSNVQQGRILAAALNGKNLDADFGSSILKNMKGEFDSRIRILDASGKLLCDSAVIEGKLLPEEKYSREDYVDLSSKETSAANNSFLYRFFSSPVRIYRRLFRSPVDYSLDNADFYTNTDVFTGQEVLDALEGKYGAKTRISSGNQVSVTLYSALPIFESSESSKVIGVVLVSRSTYKILQNLYELRLDLAKIFLRSLIVVIFIAIFLTFRISFPLKKLSKQTSNCADKKGHIIFTEFAGKNRRDEIGDLSRSFSSLIERLNKRIKFSQAFSSDISHEFKNPLAAIRTSAEVLSDPELDIEDRNNLSNAIIGEVDYLQTLLNGVKNISKIDAGDVFNDDDKISIPVNEYIKSVIKKISDKNRKVEFEFIEKSENPQFNIPEDYLYRISENLIDNAASFASKVKITSEIINTKGQSNFVLIVEDNGKGICDDAKEKVFNRFYSERPENQRESHTGLGLSIVKSIVDSLEGSIYLEDSKDLGGALFKIVLKNTISQ